MARGESEIGSADKLTEPVPNSFDWRNLTNVLWIEQPVGTGYTQGNVTITNETGLAEQFVEAYEQIVSLFGLQGYDLYLSGESYAGYISLAQTVQICKKLLLTMSELLRPIHC